MLNLAVLLNGLKLKPLRGVKTTVFPPVCTKTKQKSQRVGKGPLRPLYRSAVRLCRRGHRHAAKY